MANQHTVAQIFRHSLKFFPLFLLCIFFSCSSMAQELSSDSRRAIKHYEEGNQLYRQSKLKAAIVELKAALEKDKDFYEAHTVLAYVHLDLMQYDLAKAAFKKALDINPSAIPNNYFFLAELELKDGEYQAAKEHYQSFINSDPQNQGQLNRSREALTSIDFAIEAINNPVPFEPKNLGSAINSENAEYFPSLTVDGNTILFTRKLPSNQSPMGYNEDFFIAQKNENGEWQKAVNMGQPINTANNEGAPSLSADGNILIFTACELYGDYGGKRKGFGSCDLFITAKGGGNQWSRPYNLGKKINTNHWETQPSFSADGKTLYFIRGRRDRTGNQTGNIFICQLTEKGGWSTPEPLSNTINTPGNEESVFIHPDGKSLYFSSDGHPGMGGLDIFKSEKDSNGQWTKPVNLGYPINTHKNENSLLVAPNGKLAYFASDREEGFGELDLYGFDLPEEHRATPVSYFAGKIYDKDTQEPLSAHFQLIDLESGSTTVASYSNPDGKFLIALPAGKDYALNVAAEGYLFYSDNFSMKKSDATKPFKKNVPLKPIKVGEKIILKNIFFETAKYALKKESKIELDKVVQFLEKNPSVTIEVSGHTDSVGSDADNKTLSQNRAKSVVDYLLKNGIEKSRISAKGYGSQEPVAGNETAEGRAQNRRTEFKILGL